MGSPMPERYVGYGELWKSLNPDMELHDWTEEEIMDSQWWNVKVLQDLYTKSKLPGADMVAYYTHLADVIDYELIWEHGGWYFNTDLKPIKPLSVLQQPEDLPALAMEDDVHAVNMAMYGPKNSAFFAKVIDNLPKRYFSMPGAYMNASTGVQLLMQTLAQYDGHVVRYDRRVFNPIHWSEFNYGTVPNVDIDFPEETVAVHEWLHRTNQRAQRVVES
jgi:mannosyltransferase OCH1-like enzyme